MPFQPGHNLGKGRPLGSKNKISEEIKEAFTSVLENRLPDVERWLLQVSHEDPAKALEILIKLSNRFLPELNRTEMTGKDGEELFKNITFNFGTPPEEPKEE